MADARSIIEPYAAFIGRPLERAAQDLESFALLLSKWQRVQNLVSRETEELWARHVADSLQILRYLRPEDTTILDIGSGGGFPAIPLAICLSRHATEFTLVESNARKAAFLRAATRALGLKVKVKTARIEQVAPRETSVVTSRALAALPTLLGWIAPWLGQGTRALLHKGREFGDELDKSRAAWQFDVIVHPSDTDASGVILEITDLEAIAKS